MLVRWGSKIASSWSLGQASGQYFQGWEISHPSGARAAFGCREAEYYEWETTLDTEGLVDGFVLTATENTELTIGLAAAWIDRPTNDDERVAPWFAVDVALDYQEAFP